MKLSFSLQPRLASIGHDALRLLGGSGAGGGDPGCRASSRPRRLLGARAGTTTPTTPHAAGQWLGVLRLCSLRSLCTGDRLCTEAGLLLLCTEKRLQTWWVW